MNRSRTMMAYGSRRASIASESDQIMNQIVFALTGVLDDLQREFRHLQQQPGIHGLALGDTLVLVLVIVIAGKAVSLSLRSLRQR